MNSMNWHLFKKLPVQNFKYGTSLSVHSCGWFWLHLMLLKILLVICYMTTYQDILKEVCLFHQMQYIVQECVSFNKAGEIKSPWLFFWYFYSWIMKLNNEEIWENIYWKCSAVTPQLSSVKLYAVPLSIYDHLGFSCGWKRLWDTFGFCKNMPSLTFF